MRAFYWAKDKAGTPREQHAEGLVVALRLVGQEWVAHLTFGPLLDLVLPTEFKPSQVESLSQQEHRTA